MDAQSDPDLRVPAELGKPARYQIAEVTRFVVVDTKLNIRLPTSYDDPEDAFRVANRRNRSAGAPCLKRFDYSLRVPSELGKEANSSDQPNSSLPASA